MELQHIEKVFKHKDLEQQLVDAKLAQTSLQATEEKERNIKEKTLVKIKLFLVILHTRNTVKRPNSSDKT